MTVVLPDVPGWVTGEVDRVADQYSVDRPRALPAWALAYLYELDTDQAFDRTETLVVGDGGVDGWYYDDRDQVIVLLQAKWSDQLESKKYSAADLDDLIRAFAALHGPAESLANMDNKLLELRADLETAQQNGAGIVLAYVTAGRVTDEAKQAIEAAAQGIANCAVEFYDLQRLSDLRGAEEIITDLTGQQVDFEAQTETTISMVSTIVDGEPVRAAVATLDGRKLGDVVWRLKPSIFHANVRYSLGHRNKINKGISETVKSASARSSFWLFNNGITVVCEELVVDHDSGVVHATNPQIVNGAQTSSSLADLRASVAPGEVSVQARFIEIVPSRKEAPELVRNISQFTNSQSPVKVADLRSNEPRHTVLQSMFDSLPSPVFYERRRGEWGALRPAQQTRYGSPARRVQKDDVGQRWRAYSGEPAQAISKKDEIFSSASVEGATFDPQRSAELYMLSHELFSAALALMSKKNAADLAALVPGWFTDGVESERLSALRKAPRYVAAYATALANEVLQWRYGSVGKMRAARLREVLASGLPEAVKFWRLIFKSLFSWANSQSPANIKSQLAKDVTLAEIKTYLANELAGQDKATCLPAISAT